jgi:hypothetical protein
VVAELVTVQLAQVVAVALVACVTIPHKLYLQQATELQ